MLFKDKHLPFGAPQTLVTNTIYILYFQSEAHEVQNEQLHVYKKEWSCLFSKSDITHKLTQYNIKQIINISYVHIAYYPL